MIFFSKGYFLSGKSELRVLILIAKRKSAVSNVFAFLVLSGWQGFRFSQFSCSPAQPVDPNTLL